MHIWLVTTGEPLPISRNRRRLMRTALVARHLLSRGHSVTWWTSRFCHFERRFLSDDDVRVNHLGTGLSVRLLEGRSYSGTVSVSRLVDHWMLGRAFSRQAVTAAKPDLIVASYPPIELAAAAGRYARSAGVPLAVDVRDLWPDVFASVLPAWMAGAANAAIKVYDRMASRALERSDLIIGITEEICDWAVKKTGRPIKSAAIPLAYQRVVPNDESKVEAQEFWARNRVPLDPEKRTMICCYFGAISASVDFGPVIQAAARLEREGSPVLFVLCGSGTALTGLKEQAGSLKNVVFAGTVGPAEIFVLMEHGSLGLAPYRKRCDFQMSIPNKVPEYLSSGLPIVWGIEDSVCARLLSHCQCGWTYDSGNADQLYLLLRKLCRNQAVLDGASTQARHLYHERFDADLVYARYCDLLEEMAG